MTVSQQMRSAIKVGLSRPIVEVPVPEQVIVREQAPIDIRLGRWFLVQVWTPRRIIRFLTWVFNKLFRGYIMARTFCIAIVGGKVEDKEYNIRQEICGACPANEGGHCKSCRCWKWPPAKLSFKNRLRKWSCPERRHPGRYVEWINFHGGSCGGQNNSGTNVNIKSE